VPPCRRRSRPRQGDARGRSDRTRPQLYRLGREASFGGHCPPVRARTDPERRAVSPWSGSVATRQAAARPAGRAGSPRTAGLASLTRRVGWTLDDRLPGRPEAVSTRQPVQPLGRWSIQAVAQAKPLDVALVDPSTEERSEDGPANNGNGPDNDEDEREHATEDGEQSSGSSMGRLPYPPVPRAPPHHPGLSNLPMSGALPLKASARTAAPRSIAGDPIPGR